MLTIRDGKGHEKQVLLDVNLLRTGSVVYRPTGARVVFRLVVLGQNGTHLGEAVAAYPKPISASGSNPEKESE
jgi:hypothetical protein